MSQLNPSDFQRYGHLELLAKQVVEGFITGLHKSPFHGFSVEFAEHRLYNKGEATRHIDWKLYGRTEKLFVKRYEEETNLRCQIIIDNSSSMYFPVYDKEEKGKFNKITFSVYCAAVLIHMLRSQRDAVGLSLFSESIELHTPTKSSSVHQKFLYNELEKLFASFTEKQKRKTFAVDALHEIAERVHKRSLVVIFSDMIDSENTDAIFSALQHLKHNKHEVILFHTLDKSKEVEFNFENRPYRFIDMETGEELKLHSNEVKQEYVKAIGEYKRELYLKCAQYKIDLIEADINAGLDQVLLPYLIKRERMI